MFRYTAKSICLCSRGKLRAELSLKGNAIMYIECDSFHVDERRFTGWDMQMWSGRNPDYTMRPKAGWCIMTGDSDDVPSWRNLPTSFDNDRTQPNAAERKCATQEHTAQRTSSK